MVEPPDRSARLARVFTIPPGAPFLDTFVDAVLDGTVVSGFGRVAGPLALADATIFVPTRRSARAMAAAFAERIGAPSTFLPTIVPLGGLDALETEALLDGGSFGFDEGSVPVAVDPMVRRMALTRLILAWSRSVRGALLAPDDTPNGPREETLLVATTPADAWHLSGELASLLDEMVLDGVPWAAIAPLGTEAFDRYWGITLDFLRVAVEHWPAILAERGAVDPATRHLWLIEAAVARLERPDLERRPTIVAGVAATDPATARLMAAIARLPAGAVVLRGLDQHLDDAAWAAVDPVGAPDAPGGAHAQALLHRLLPVFGVSRADVVPLGRVSPALAARGRFVSEALRPAETTDAWQPLMAGGLDLAAALVDVTVIEAADEGEEALALAVALRESLEGEGTAVLVTPDRALARRVREELWRWGIAVDDSGGEPLPRTPAGALARLVVDCVTDELEPATVLALLAHPATRLGRSRVAVDHLARTAELVLFRGIVQPRALFDVAGMVGEARRRAGEPHAPAPLRRLGEEDFAALESFLGDLVDVLMPLHRLGSGVPLRDWLDVHQDALAAMVRTDTDASALRGPDGTALGLLFDDLARAADPALELDRSDYAALFDRILAEVTVRGPARSHPRLKILGLVEMRLLSADRVLLGGLDEAVWPPQVRTDAFLNRPMRAELGLATPERRIGEAAHDFETAFGNAAVIVSRARKRGGSPTVPSRFLQRMKAVGGPTWDDCVARGNRYLDLARALDRPDRSITIRRPAPKPSVDLRPTQMSVTRVETLRRDPYAVYAERILKLKPLDPVAAAVGPREWGTLFHGVLSEFVDSVRHGPLPPAALSQLLDRTRDAFADMLVDPAFRTFMGPRVEAWAQNFHQWHAARQPELATLHVERKGTLVIPLDDGSSFTLTANADRIETLPSGAIRIVDYKTGRPPTPKEVRVGFAPQLTLEAAIAQGGGFDGLGPDAAVESALYVKFGAGKDFAAVPLAWDDRSFGEVVADHIDGLRTLLNSFRDPATGYVARPYPQFAARFSDYDHLSRVKEWSITGGVPEGDGE